MGAVRIARTSGRTTSCLRCEPPRGPVVRRDRSVRPARLVGECDVTWSPSVAWTPVTASPAPRRARTRSGAVRPARRRRRLSRAGRRRPGRVRHTKFGGTVRCWSPRTGRGCCWPCRAPGSTPRRPSRRSGVWPGRRRRTRFVRRPPPRGVCRDDGGWDQTATRCRTAVWDQTAMYRRVVCARAEQGDRPPDQPDRGQGQGARCATEPWPLPAGLVYAACRVVTREALDLARQCVADG